MIGTSIPEFVFIRVCVFLIQYTTPLCLFALIIVLIVGGRPALSLSISPILIAYSIFDFLYAIFIWFPYARRFKNEARHPPPLSLDEKRELFNKCLNNIPDFERYLRLWFLEADASEIRRDNVRDFILWAFFDAAPESATEVDLAEASEFVEKLERRIGRELESGSGTARALRLTLDAVETRYRSFIWFLIVGGVDFATHCRYAWGGFRYHAQPRLKAVSVIPPRLHNLFARNWSPSKQLSYWYRPHTSSHKVPVLFLHGIGIGLWPYASFLSRLNGKLDREGDIGVIAIELLSVSFHLLSDPMRKAEFLAQLDIILEEHRWDKFVVAAHSYGTVLASHMIHSQRFGPRIQGIALLDPVSILLHQPDVAYNFTRRKPQQANEWQLWYFASMDPGIAYALSRHFFWRENIIWKEELLDVFGKGKTRVGAILAKRRVAVCLAERDLIVDTRTIAKYLVEGENWVPGSTSSKSGGLTPENQSGNHHKTRDGIEVLWFPCLDHGQMFDSQHDQERLCHVLRQHCSQKQ